MNQDEKEKEKIFREKAHRLYVQNQQKIVVLKLMKPKLIPVFWTILVGLALLTLLTWSAEVPIAFGGAGLVVAQGEDAETVLITLFPPEIFSDIAVAQQVTTRAETLNDPMPSARIDQIEPEVMSPRAIREKFNLDETQAASVQGPAVVATARFEEQGENLEAYLGSIFPVEVEVGRRRALSLMPGLRRLHGDSK